MNGAGFDADEDHVVASWRDTVKPQWRGKRSSAPVETTRTPVRHSLVNKWLLDLSQLLSLRENTEYYGTCTDQAGSAWPHGHDRGT